MNADGRSRIGTYCWKKRGQIYFSGKPGAARDDGVKNKSVPFSLIVGKRGLSPFLPAPPQLATFTTHPTRTGRVAAAGSQPAHHRPLRRRQNLYRLRPRTPGLPTRTHHPLLPPPTPVPRPHSGQGRRQLPQTPETTGQHPTAHHR